MRLKFNPYVYLANEPTSNDPHHLLSSSYITPVLNFLLRIRVVLLWRRPIYKMSFAIVDRHLCQRLCDRFALDIGSSGFCLITLYKFHLFHTFTRVCYHERMAHPIDPTS